MVWHRRGPRLLRTRGSARLRIARRTTWTVLIGSLVGFAVLVGSPMDDGLRLLRDLILSALAWPVRADSGGDGRSALLVTGAKPITAGEPVVWCTVVVTAPAVLRRDGRVQAQGRPCDHARLGAVEQEMDHHCGPGMIDRIAADVRPTGKKVKAVARRKMSVAFTVRAVLLMTLMPGADHREVLTTLLGELPEVPWRRPHTVPLGTVPLSWRTAIGEAPLQQLQRELLAAVGTQHRDPALPRVEVGGGLRLGAIDGTVTRMPDTAANRAAFGTAGQAETGYPSSVTCTSPTR